MNTISILQSMISRNCTKIRNLESTIQYYLSYCKDESAHEWQIDNWKSCLKHGQDTLKSLVAEQKALKKSLRNAYIVKYSYCVY